ncbi:MAG: hypothetical protein ACLUNZ_06130 [Evtepia sp.]
MDYDIKRIFFRVCVLLNGSGKRALLRARPDASARTHGGRITLLYRTRERGTMDNFEGVPNF